MAAVAVLYVAWVVSTSAPQSTSSAIIAVLSRLASILRSTDGVYPDYGSDSVWRYIWLGLESGLSLVSVIGRSKLRMLSSGWTLLREMMLGMGQMIAYELSIANV